MKLTLKQRIIVLFTGKLPEPLRVIDTTPLIKFDTTILRPDTAAVSQRTKHSHDNYATLAKKCRKNPNQWTQIATAPRSTAAPLASKIRHGGLAAFKKPRGGHYDARLTPCMSEYIVEARFIPNNKKENTKKNTIEDCKK